MIILFLFPVINLFAEDVSVFERTYVREPGKPKTETDSFIGIAGLAKIKVTNGSNSKDVMVSSADIEFNNETIAKESDFNQQVDLIEVETNLIEGANTLDVTIKGAPGGSLTVHIIEDDFDGDGFNESQGDCNDNDSSISPDVAEVCDGKDNDCDGEIDEGVKTTYYEDLDGDEYGNPDISVTTCEQPMGYVADNTDCNDSNATVNPGATEIKNNGIDDDCSTLTPDEDAGANLPPDPGKEGEETLLGIDTDGDGVRDDIQRYIYFTYPDDEKLRLGLTFYAIEFQGVLKDAEDRDLSYVHAVNMERHGECIFYIKDMDSFEIRDSLRAEMLNTRERSIAFITFNENMGGKSFRSAPQKKWNESCSFDVDAIGGHK